MSIDERLETLGSIRFAEPPPIEELQARAHRRQRSQRTVKIVGAVAVVLAALTIAALALSLGGHSAQTAQVGTGGPEQPLPADATHGGVWWVPPALRDTLIQDSLDEAQCMSEQGITDWPALPPDFGNGSTTSPTVGPGDTGNDHAIAAITGPCHAAFEQGRQDWLDATQQGAHQVGS